jgi:hypothetical protein
MMKRILYLSLAALMALAVSCNKDKKPGNDDPGKYGVDGKTPMPEAVDIGLVVNGKTIKWASFNLGASKEYEYGDYYAWGETEPKSEYSDKNYKHCNDNLFKLIAYCTKDKTDYWDSSVKPDGPDGVLQLLPSDDAAHVLLGGNWRLPTQDEFQALLDLKNDKENYEWENWAVINADGKDVHGLRITQKSTGNSIFFPAAGTSFKPDVAIDEGKYWSSSLDTTFPIAAGSLGFDSLTWVAEGGHRYTGFSIRPVWEE